MNVIKRYYSMYKLFALPLLFCIGLFSNANADNNVSNEINYFKLFERLDSEFACMDVELKTQPVRCFGFCDGFLQVIVTGGQEPYTYQWSNGLTSSFSATLPAGEFTVTVTDAAGCEVVKTARVGSPTEIKPNLQVEGSCDPDTPTTASVSPSGGVGNYIIEWSTGEPGRSITNLQSGIEYSVTITTRGNGCSVTEDFTVADGLTIDTDKTDIACEEDDTGTATATGLSGQTPYTYTWSTGFSETTDGSSTIENLSAGTYTVTVTDAAGCEAIGEIEIISGDGLNLELESAPATCKDDQDGMANVIPAGGTPPYRFQWSDGQTTGSAIDLAAGTYGVTVIDMLGCQATGTVEVESSSNLEVNATVDASNGSVTANASGGVEPYTYQWDNDDTTPTSDGYEAGDTYSVKITDALGCMETITGEFPPEDNPEINLIGIDPKCADTDDGRIEADVTGGTTPYTYLWSNGETTESIENLTAGTYQVTVSDANGNTAEASITLTAPSAISVNVSFNIDNPCDDGTVGNAITEPTGGTGDYTFLWSTGATSASIELEAGQNYSVTVTDENDCTAEESFSTPAGTALSIEIEKMDETCKGDANGMISVAVTNGTAPFTYEWSNGAETEKISDLAIGEYVVTVTDANGCSVSESVSIEAGNMIMVEVEINAANGAVTANPSGGTAPYTYIWSNGESTQTAVNYEAGDTYSLTVTDAEGCEGIATAMIPSDGDTPIISITSMPPTCPGFSNGSIMITVSGGTPPYTYLWSTRQSTSSINGLSAGTYIVTVTDAEGATATESITITDPDPIEITINPSSGDICDGANTNYEASATGGTAPYTFAWSNGTNSATLSNVAAGDYFLTVTDANDCEEVIFLKVSPPLTVEVIGQAVRCNDFCDGSVRAKITGGTGPFTFNWSNGQTGQILENLAVGEYTVTVTDANGCEAIGTGEVTAPPAIESNLRIDGTCEEGSTISASVNPMGGVGNFNIRWSTGATGTSITGLVAGESYTVKITDGNGCMLTEEFTIPNEAGLVVNADKTDIACGSSNGGSATATVLSGVAPYTYEWSNGFSETTNETTSTIENLAAGTYTVTITDTNGCEGTIMVTVEQRDGLILDLSSTNAICGDEATGMANVVPSGGTAPYVYIWSNGQTFGTATNLVPGEYSVTVTDVAGCEGIGTVTVGQGAIITVETTVEESNNNITVTPSGGTAPYTYAWDNGETTQTAVNYEAGDAYSVTITDANGCQTTVTGELPSDGEFNISITSNPPSCPNFSNGSITANVSGGTPPYTYQWSTGQTSASISGLSGGTYSVTVTDADGASASETITLVNPDPIEIDIQASSGDVCDGTNTDYEANVTGGTSPYTYAWSNGTTSATLSGAAAGDYFLTVTDANGCEKVEYLKISPPLEVEVIGQAVRCNDFCDGSVRAKITGGTGPFTFNWSNGQTGQILENLPVGIYTVTVTDANGCEAIGTGEVTAPPAIESNLRIEGTCEEGSTISANVNPTGGVGGYRIRWSTGAMGRNITNLVRGESYTVKITDANGCMLTEMFTIPNEPALIVNGSKTDIACGNTNGGSATASVLSGEAPYTYEWSNGFTETTNDNTSSIEDVEAGTYTVTVTDANGCEGTTTVTVEQTDGLILDSSSTNSTCEDSPDGMANVVPSGGVAPYRYQWSDGQTTGTAVGLVAGDYVVTVTDLLGCRGVDTVTVEADITIELSVSIDTTNNTITVNPTSNVDGAFTYQWSNGESTQTATGYVPCVDETYSVTVTITVTDNQGNSEECTKVISGDIPCPDDPPFTPIVEVTPKCDDEGGTATLTISGGTPPFEIVWENDDNDGNELTNTGLEPGTYTITITDADGNEVTTTYTIEEIPLEAEEVVTVDAKCNAVNGGSATVNVTSGNAPYTYTWSTGDSETTDNTSSSIDGLAAGTYSVTITDKCGNEETKEFVIEQEDNLTATTTSTPATCESATGSATVTVSDGTAPYTYEWSNGITETSNQTTSTIDGLEAGTYTVTVTDANGCKTEVEITVEQENNLTVTTTSQNACCEDTADGSASVTVENGTAPYTYEWSTSTTETTNETSSTIDDLLPGDYTVTVTDSLGCEGIGMVTVDPQITIDLSVTIDTTDNQTSITVNPTSNVDGEFTYEWSNGETTQTATGYVPCIDRTYSVTVTITTTDADGNEKVCTEVISGNVPCPDDPSDPLTATVMPTPTCEGEADGTAMLTIDGGTLPYTIVWENDDNDADELKNTGLAAGTYSVTVSDADTSIVVQYTIEEISLELQIAITPTSCNSADGSITVTVLGGNPDYTYTWTGESSGEAISSENSFTISDLGTGNYDITVTDGNGCTVDTMNVFVPEEQPELDIAIKPENCGRENGSITVTVRNGTPDYNYEWTGESSGTGTSTTDTFSITGLSTGRYSITVTDANNCEADTMNIFVPEEDLAANIEAIQPENCGNMDGKITVTVKEGTIPYTFKWEIDGVEDSLQSDDISTMIENLEAGSYNITVTDANGCQAELSDVIVPERNPTITIDAIQAENCGMMDGKITATVQDGTSPYTFQWEIDGEVDSLVSQDATIMIEDLSTGSYNITVTDANGCEASIEDVLVPEENITVTIEAIQPENCGMADGDITVSVQNGMSPYTYKWELDGVIDSLEANIDSIRIINLSSGSYDITVIDANGCEATISDVIVPEENITATLDLVQAENCGMMDGVIGVSVEGGMNPYTYKWGIDNGGILDSLVSDETSIRIENLSMGTYDVTITDANGCEAIINDILVPEENISVSIDAIQAENCGQEDGKITVSVQDGTNPYTYVWEIDGILDSLVSDESTVMIDSLSTGNYNITVTDANGCQDEASDVNVPEENISAIIDAIQAENCGQADGAVTVSVQGGTSPYTFEWQIGGAGQSFQSDDPTVILGGLPAGNYSITITDANGCQAFISDVLVEEISVELEIVGTTEDDCGQFVGRISVGAMGGTAPYRYEWERTEDGQRNSEDGAEENFVIEGLESGTYNVTVTDANGCTDTEDGIEIRSNELPCEEPFIFIPNAFTPNGDDVNDVLVVQGPHIIALELKIYNRWGQLVFETEGDLRTGDEWEGWDGTFLNMGEPVEGRVFGYTLFVECECNGDTFSKTGNVTVIR